MKNALAKIVSGVFSPYITIPIFGVLAIAAYSYYDNFLIWVAFFLLLTVIAPFVYIYVAYKKGKISDLHVAIKEQRERPFVISVAGAIILWVLFYFYATQLLALASALALCGVVFALVTKYWKVSIHAAAFAGGVLLVAIAYANLNLLWLWLILPIIIWARIVRERHNIFQSLAAIILVIVCVLATVK